MTAILKKMFVSDPQTEQRLKEIQNLTLRNRSLLLREAVRVYHESVMKQTQKT